MISTKRTPFSTNLRAIRHCLPKPSVFVFPIPYDSRVDCFSPLQPHDFGKSRLHAEGKFVTLDHAVDLGILLMTALEITVHRLDKVELLALFPFAESLVRQVLDFCILE